MAPCVSNDFRFRPPSIHRLYLFLKLANARLELTAPHFQSLEALNNLLVPDIILMWFSLNKRSFKGLLFFLFFKAALCHPPRLFPQGLLCLFSPDSKLAHGSPRFWNVELSELRFAEFRISEFPIFEIRLFELLYSLSRNYNFRILGFQFTNLCIPSFDFLVCSKLHFPNSNCRFRVCKFSIYDVQMRAFA